MSSRWGTARSRKRQIAAAVLAALVACALFALAGSSAPAAKPKAPTTTPVVYVGNNWEGTADVLRWTPPTRSKPASFTRIARLNIIPDHAERMQEIQSDPERLAFFLAIRQFVGEGHDQFVDDMYSTNDGRNLIVSRPSFADVVSIDLATGQIVWRFPMEGQRSDHMGLSPDGSRVAVSDSTANVVHVLKTATGEEDWQFPSGDTPHENTYSQDGTRIYHGSIGLVYTPADQPQFDSTKGERYFQIVDTNTHQILERLDMGQKLEEAGHPDMSSAVRPMALSPDEQMVYFQVSFFHGFVEYDFNQDRVTRVANLPKLTQEPRENYVLDSAHHGIAMNGAGTKLCVSGTMDDYAAIVSRKNFDDHTILPLGVQSYWSTSSADGDYCFVSWSRSDKLSAISYGSEKEVASIKVGAAPEGELAHPQRVRNGVVRTDVPIAGI